METNLLKPKELQQRKFNANKINYNKPETCILSNNIFLQLLKNRLISTNHQH